MGTREDGLGDNKLKKNDGGLIQGGRYEALKLERLSQQRTVFRAYLKKYQTYEDKLFYLEGKFKIKFNRVKKVAKNSIFQCKN